jgi:DNA-binding GntR family transcriptional regulator
MSWTQKGVTDDLRRRIRAGRDAPHEQDALPAGVLLPTTTQLMEHYGVARQTAISAVRVLARTGLVLSNPKNKTAGVRVVGLPVQTLHSDRYRSDLLRAPDGSYTFEREMRLAGWDPHTDYLHVGWAPAPAYVAQAFGQLEGDQVVERIRRRRASPPDEAGHPVGNLERTITIFESHLPAWVGEAVPMVATHERVGKGGTYALLADNGLTIEDRDETIDFRPPTDDEAFAFSVPDLEIVVDVTRRCHTGDGRIVTIDREITLPWCVRFEYRVRQEDQRR